MPAEEIAMFRRVEGGTRKHVDNRGVCGTIYTQKRCKRVSERGSKCCREAGGWEVRNGPRGQCSLTKETLSLGSSWGGDGAGK